MRTWNLVALLAALLLVARGAVAAPGAGNDPRATPNGQRPATEDGRAVERKAKDEARDEALARALAIQVRSAPLSEVVEQMAEASGVKMRLARELLPPAAAGAGDQRVTLYAGRATVEEFQRAVATLLRLRWVRNEEPPYRYTLEEEPRARAQRYALRERQAARFLERLAETAVAVATPATAAEHARALREAFRQRYPEYPEQKLEELDISFLRQALLIAPLNAILRARLASTDSLSVPLAWLDDPSAALLASFALGSATTALDDGRRVLSRLRDARNLMLPTARVHYRLLYGDRWTDLMLRVRVGTPDDAAVGLIPSILFREEDGSALYPHSRQRPTDAAVWRRLPPTFSVPGKSWEEDLLRLARATKIRVASDAYLRPTVFDLKPELPSLAGQPLIEALDRLCRYHGMFWWKEGDWYFFRHRAWVEEARVAAPDRFLRQWAQSAREDGRLSPDDLVLMSGLEDEQLITLGLLASRHSGAAPASGPLAEQQSLRALDVENAELAAASLMLFRSLAPVQRELALTSGLPALWMTPVQQQFFAAVAAELGFFPAEETLPFLGFLVQQQFDRPAGPKGPVSGRIQLQWHFGPRMGRTATLALHFPAGE